MYSYYDRHGRKVLSKKRQQLHKGEPIAYTRFTRVPVEIKIEETGELFEGRAFLFDLRSTSFSLFSMHAIERGAKISLVLEHPRKIFIRAEVVWCTLAPWNPKILSEKVVPYRVYVNFHFDSPEERAAVQSFCDSITNPS